MSRHSVKNAVYLILSDIPQTRDYDRLLVWEFWKRQGIEKKINCRSYISKRDFMNIATSYDYITRIRRKIQEDTPSLRSSNWASQKRSNFEKVIKNYLKNK